MVAKVRPLKSSAVAVSYFEKDGYYAKDDPEHRDASFWHGEAAKDLGLKGHVLPGEFEDLLEGWVPGTEIRLGRMREGENDHRPGWDITFSAPKSVSLEALVIGDRRVIRAHDDAVHATLKWIETDLLQTRGWDPITRQRPRVAADGMIVAGFRHVTSRIGDPQLHTHCVLANMTRNAAGEWRSVEVTKIRRSEKLIGAYYRNELARRLEALGMAVTPRMIGRVPGFELAGYDRSFMDAFSGRRAEILAYLEKHDLPYNAKNAEMAALHTRQGKKEIGLSQLVPQWRERAREMGLARDRGVLRPDRPLDPATGERVEPVEVPPPDLPANELRSLRRAPALPKLPKLPREAWTPSRGPAELSPVPEAGVLEAVARAVAHVAERRTSIPETEIRAVALSHAPGRYGLGEIDRAIDRLVTGGELIEVERKGMDRAFVTEQAVWAERRILASMRDARGAGKALGDADAVEAPLADSRLTAGQKEAVRTVLLSDDIVVGVQGHAGSGKTTMLREVKELLGERPIQGLAPSAAAARVLGREAGIPSTTLQWFLTRYGGLSDAEQLDKARADYRGTVLAVDECSMIDTGRMRELLRIAERLGVARVALVGDTEQLRAVDAGQPFRLLQKAGMRTATMDQVLRQREPALLASVMHARHGEAGAAIQGLGERRVREVEREELGAEAARCWLALAPEDRAETAVMAPTHEIRRQTNEAVRVGLAEEGALHGRALEVDRLVNRRLTRALAAELASYEPGDTVVFHRDVFGCRKDDICTVTGRAEGKVILAHADGGERGFRPSGNAATYLGLYDTERIELRAGERIRWTRNRKAPPPRAGHPPQPDLVNGGEAEIVEIGYKRVRFRDGEREFSLALKDPQLRHLDHAYCTTVHAAQGKTARAAIAVLDAGGAADRELFHVEISRVTDEFLLLTDDREALIELLEARAGGEEGALEALGLDPANLFAVDPEPFAALAADWRALRKRAGETNTVPFFLPGYREVMARAATLAATGGLPADLRRLVERMLEEHREHLGRDREVGDLVRRIQGQWRRWPQLGCAAPAEGADEGSRYDAWREASETLLAEGRERLAEAAGGAAARHLDAMPGGRDGLAGALRTLERTRLFDDARRFGQLWRELRERAARAGIPELYAEGYAEVSALGATLASADGLDARRLGPVGDWRDLHAAQTALADEVRALPRRVAAWREQRAELALSGDIAADPDDPAEPARRDWRAEGEALETAAHDMLRPEDSHAPYLDALPGARGAVGRAAAEVGDALGRDRMEGFAWLEAQMSLRGGQTERFHQHRFAETIAEARALAGYARWSEDERKAVDSWLRYDEEATRLCGEIRGWPGQARALLDGLPPADAALENLTEWRHRAEPLLTEARAMLAEDSSHAPHLTAMPPERKALDEATRRLDAEALDVELREAIWLMGSTREFGERTGGMRYDAPGYGALMERVRALDERPGLPARVREMVDVVLDYDERRGRDRGGAFPEAAERVESARDGMPPSAGPDGIEERQKEIREQIARDEQARIAAEEERRAAERARIDDNLARATERLRAVFEEEREAANRRNRATTPSHEESQYSARAAREATRLADRLDACLERRDRLLERAEGKLESNRPVVDLGRVHARWRREADRVIEAGRKLLQDERYAPHLDALGGREKIEAAVARLEGARVLDHLPARIAAEWEKLEDRVRETGSHRFFLPEHESACARMDRVYPRDDVAHRFVKDELGMRERMGRQVERLDDVANRLTECALERGRAVRQDIPFLRQESYADWRFRAERVVEAANEILAYEGEYAPHFAQDPKLRETVRTMSAALGRSLAGESPEWERIGEERIETERQRRLDRSQDRGFSM